MPSTDRQSIPSIGNMLIWKVIKADINRAVDLKTKNTSLGLHSSHVPQLQIQILNNPSNTFSFAYRKYNYLMHIFFYFIIVCTSFMMIFCMILSVQSE